MSVDKREFETQIEAAADELRAALKPAIDAIRAYRERVEALYDTADDESARQLGRVAIGGICDGAIEFIKALA